jgi:hypothetical protein
MGKKYKSEPKVAAGDANATSATAVLPLPLSTGSITTVIDPLLASLFEKSVSLLPSAFLYVALIFNFAYVEVE